MKYSIDYDTLRVRLADVEAKTLPMENTVEWKLLNSIRRLRIEFLHINIEPTQREIIPKTPSDVRKRRDTCCPRYRLAFAVLRLLGVLQSKLSRIRSNLTIWYLRAKGSHIDSAVVFRGWPMLRIENFNMLTIMEGAIIEPHVVFWQGGINPIEIGRSTYIGIGTIIHSTGPALDKGGIKIGDGTLIGANCLIQDTDHGTVKGKPIREQPNSAAPIVIGCDCWIGAAVCILKGSHIKNGAIIGANAVVTSDINDDGIAVGVPARIIKYRQ